MENQHRLIKGYRELGAEEIALMNESKELAEKVGALVRTIDEHVTKLTMKAIDASNFRGQEPAVQEEVSRLYEAEPQEWVKEAKKTLQTGFMQLNRAIAQPTTF